jgi:hypothetical protein
MGRILWLASYPRSGNAWVRTFLVNLIANDKKGVPFREYPRYVREESNLRWYVPILALQAETASVHDLARVRTMGQQNIIKGVSENIFVRTHLANRPIVGYQQINRSISAGAIYIVRNPLDGVISFADQFGITINEAISQIESPNNTVDSPNQVPELVLDWSSHVSSWTANESSQLHVMRYEDMIDEPEATFGSLARFLHIDTEKDPDGLQRAIKFSSFDMIKNLEKEGVSNERLPSSERLVRADTKDQWKDKLNPAQVKRIRARHGEQMKRFGYDVD